MIGHKGKHFLGGARSVATGAALFATGRALVIGRNKHDEDENPEFGDEEPQEERDERPRRRTRVSWLPQ
jgi:hypothetical protein